MKEAVAYNNLKHELISIYDEREAGNIADWVLEYITGKKRWKRNTENQELTAQQNQKLTLFTNELLQHKPVQYVLGEAWFCGLRFFVNQHVLIPRPETEELVQLITSDQQNQTSLYILDIGTGSGCIPIALKKKLPGSQVTSLDISHQALEVAIENAHHLDTEIQFECMNFLDEQNWILLQQFDIIVSNPPYIPINERERLSKNVIDFEPGEALFVPDQQALIFYDAIEKFGKTHLKYDGKIYMEVHEDFAKAVLTLFINHGWQTHIENDMFGKERFVTATLKKQRQK